MKARVASVLAAAMIFAPVALATQIRQFDRFDGDDQIKFVDKLVDSVEAAAKNDPALLANVKRFFMDKKPGEEISGMGQFELSLSLARIADMDASAKNPKAPRLEVEDVMYATLFNNGFRFSNSFRPSAVAFQPQRPLGRTLTRLDGDKALAETRDWIARTVRPAPERDFTHAGPHGSVGWSGWSDDQKCIAFFTAIIGAGVVLERMGIHLGNPTPRRDASRAGIRCIAKPSGPLARRLWTRIAGIASATSGEPVLSRSQLRAERPFRVPRHRHGIGTPSNSGPLATG